METHAPRAVFLSYAREDAAAARRIAEALRSIGVEVWFDENELRGGDAWDAKIRRQIKECALFLAIISEQTQQRNEGYFRLEWELAEERTHLMVRGVPFIVPVVTDDLPDAVALVPDRFREVQWTRLPGALPTPQFVEHVKRLVTSPRRPALSGAAPSPTSTPAATSDTRHYSGLLWTAAVMGVVVLGLGTYLALRTTAKQPPAPVAAAKPAAETKTAPLVPAGPRNGPKSIAVLPFDNMSEEKEASAFFSDGMHEDILTNLALVHELYVTSRTTVMQYRGTKKTLRQIGEELGVAYVLEGSVRRAGEKVRITGQLIRADTDGHLWAKTYDREISDVFAIQAEIATVIAGELKTVISPQEKKLIERRPTQKIAAYDLYLKDRALKAWSAGSVSKREERETLLKAAVQLDPNFAEAWAELGAFLSYSYRIDPNRSEATLARAKTAIETAVRLAPDLPEVMTALGRYFINADRDYERAIAQYEQVRRLYPNYAETHFSLGNIARLQARGSDAVVHLRNAVRLDSGNNQYATTLLNLLLAGRRYAEANTELRRQLDLDPGNLRKGWLLALNSFLASGSTREVEEFLSGLSAEQSVSGADLGYRRGWAMRTGNFAEYERLRETRANSAEKAAPSRGRSFTVALFLAAQGDLAAARAELGDTDVLRSARDQEPANPERWSALARWEALLGNKEEALRCARRAVELTPESVEPVEGPSYGVTFAFVYAWTGDKDRAIAECARLLRVPWSGLNVHEMRRHPAYAPLRGDPRFEALLNDPKNNAPLF